MTVAHFIAWVPSRLEGNSLLAVEDKWQQSGIVELIIVAAHRALLLTNTRPTHLNTRSGFISLDGKKWNPFLDFATREGILAVKPVVVESSPWL